MAYSISIHNNTPNTQTYNLVASKPDIYGLSPSKVSFGCVVDQQKCEPGEKVVLKAPSERLHVFAGTVGRHGLSTGAEIRIQATQPAELGSGAFRVEFQQGGRGQFSPAEGARVSSNGVFFSTGGGISDNESGKVIGIATQHPRTVHQVGKSEVTEWQTVPICGVNPQPNRRVNINMRLAYFVECKSELSRGRVVKFDRGVGMYNVDFGDVEGEGIVVRHDGDGLWRREGEEGTGDGKGEGGEEDGADVDDE